MSQLRPRYNKEEYARLGDQAYKNYVCPHIDSGDDGKFVAIDIETGDYEIDAEELAASDALVARNPEAQVWLVRVGSDYTRRFGSRA
ncbi:MAG: hypothetical protein QF898_17625 [SAR202 cluster bacterium]|nr:hypothetical protein [SAR202 cluster bacterium]MDP6512281.1 hypothetical protein [SAR202 cluster bacterium]MDP6713939.1 hypothetical protein [SAR202 cluster bacterium]